MDKDITFDFDIDDPDLELFDERVVTLVVSAKDPDKRKLFYFLGLVGNLKVVPYRDHFSPPYILYYYSEKDKLWIPFDKCYYSEKDKLWLPLGKKFVLDIFNDEFSFVKNLLDVEMSQEQIISKKLAYYKRLVITLEKYIQKNLISLIVSIKDCYCELSLFQLDYSTVGLPIKNCKKINLNTLVVSDREKYDYFTFSLDVEYDETNIDVIENFMRELMDIPKDTICENHNVNDETIALQHLLGCLFSGKKGLRKFITIWQGDGSNGKSTLIDMLTNVFGKMIYEMQCREIAPKIERNLMSPIFNGDYKIFVTTVDTTNFIIDGYKIRLFIRNNTIPLIICNDLPIFDDEIKTRIYIVSFMNNFENKKDNVKRLNIKNNYKNQLFTWVVQGAQKFHKEGLKPSKYQKLLHDKYIGNI